VVVLLVNSLVLLPMVFSCNQEMKNVQSITHLYAVNISIAPPAMLIRCVVGVNLLLPIEIVLQFLTTHSQGSFVLMLPLDLQVCGSEMEHVPRILIVP